MSTSRAMAPRTRTGWVAVALGIAGVLGAWFAFTGVVGLFV